MLLSSFLDAKTIYFERSQKTRQELYREMVARLEHHHELPIKGHSLVDLILARDAESSTAYPTGIAIPHVRLDGFNDTLISICVLDIPIDYDGTAVNFVVLIFTDKTASKLYLNLVAALLKLSKDKQAMEALRQQKDGHDFISATKRLGISIKENLTLADLMEPNPATISPEASLRELSALMNEHNQAYIPVVDERGRYLGEVDILCLLKVGVPDYLMMMDNLNFLSGFEPLENLFEQEDILHVADIMHRDEEILSPSASVIETAHEMIQHQKRFYSVVDQGKLVGVIRAMDIFKKVIKA